MVAEKAPKVAESKKAAQPVRWSIEPGERDVRRFIPPAGLKEYWYPAVEARKVNGKPVGLKICGEQVVFFKGKEKGDVKALANVCPHRGGSLMHGDCHYPGTISCPYHGWTFDGEGNVLAVLPEGPESQVPGKIVHRAYPTRVLRGMVWVWMGEGEPAPIEHDVPPEFFWEDAGVMLFGTEVWPSNWRIAVENVSDAHVPYVHRDATFTMLVPMPLTGPQGARTVFVNERYLGQPSLVDAVKGENGVPQRVAGRSRGALQYEFPALGGGTWPLHQRRKLWAWATKWIQKRRFARPPMEPDPEWSGIGRHLPAIVHIGYRTHIINRINVPIDEGTTRQVYTHATRANGWLAKLYETIVFHTFHRWAHFSDFSVQDFKVLNPQRYDTPEYLSLTDMPNVNWRRLVAEHARDLHPAGKE